MKFLLGSAKYSCGSKDLKDCYKEAFEYFKDKITKVDDNFWNYYIEIDTIEELMKLKFFVKKELIISSENYRDCILIYDDYLE